MSSNVGPQAFEALADAIAERVIERWSQAHGQAFMTVRQVCERTGWKRGAVYGMIHRGELPRAPGRAVMVRRADVERLLTGDQR